MTPQQRKVVVELTEEYGEPDWVFESTTYLGVVHPVVRCQWLDAQRQVFVLPDGNRLVWSVVGGRKTREANDGD